MEKIKVLIVDDEVIMAEELACLLSQHNCLQIMGIYHDSELVWQKIGEQQPDVVFLDIRMPELSGIELARRFINSKKPPAIIFSTAYDSYAIQAFQVNALDYILKPFDEKDIQRVVNKLQKYFFNDIAVAKEQNAETADNYLLYSRKFTVDTGSSMNILDANDIQMVYAKDRMVFIQTIGGKNYKAKSTLQEFESRLDPKHFFRCHRNYIVNIDQIKAILSWFNRGYLLTMKDEKTEIPVSRAYVNKLREYIQF